MIMEFPRHNKGTREVKIWMAKRISIVAEPEANRSHHVWLMWCHSNSDSAEAAASDGLSNGDVVRSIIKDALGMPLELPVLNF